MTGHDGVTSIIYLATARQSFIMFFFLLYLSGLSLNLVMFSSNSNIVLVYTLPYIYLYPII